MGRRGRRRVQPAIQVGEQRSDAKLLAALLSAQVQRALWQHARVGPISLARARARRDSSADTRAPIRVARTCSISRMRPVMFGSDSSPSIAIVGASSVLSSDSSCLAIPSSRAGTIWPAASSCAPRACMIRVAVRAPTQRTLSAKGCVARLLRWPIRNWLLISRKRSRNRPTHGIWALQILARMQRGGSRAGSRHGPLCRLVGHTASARRATYPPYSRRRGPSAPSCPS